MSLDPTRSSERLHVGVNLVFLTPGAHGGLEVYAHELLRRMVERPDLRVTVFVNRESVGAGLGADEIRVPVRPSRRSQWIAGEHVLLPGAVSRAGCDVLHSLANTAPVAGSFKKVTTIHDLNYLLLPGAFRPGRKQVMGSLVRVAARASTRVITPSHAASADLQRHLGLAAGRIDVIWQGVDARSSTVPTPPAVLRARLGIRERTVILCVAAKRPNKNQNRLIEAHALLPHPRPLLLLVGHAEPWYLAQLERTVARLQLEDDVCMVDWVGDGDLEGVYGLAHVFAFPSLYEGFGLPPIEAMAKGVPVVSSTRGSLGEVVGDAAVIVDPESAPSIADGIARLLDGEAERRRLVAAGLARSQLFSWDRAVEGTIASYRRAVDPRSSS